MSVLLVDDLFESLHFKYAFLPAVACIYSRSNPIFNWPC
jgi:hypothetical protein